MDPTTAAVRDMYERYPYPEGEPVLRLGTDARFLLSGVERPFPRKPGPIQVLDAGCGRGVGLLTIASLDPSAQFTGIDINRVALQEVKKNARDRGLTNLKTQEVDLMTLEGLEVPDGGFDVIHSSGVLHHLSDPAQGLGNLRDVLATHGVICAMVYGGPGRELLRRLKRGIDIIAPPEQSIENRIAPARALAQATAGEEKILADTPWADTYERGDVEFVDRCLNVNETSYDVQGLWDFMDSAGMRFIRWTQPECWSIDKIFEDSPVRGYANTLSEFDQFRLIESVCWRPSLELTMAREDATPRKKLTLDRLESSIFAMNPDASISLSSRTMHGTRRIEKVTFMVRNQKAVDVGHSPRGSALMVLWDQNLPFTGDSFVKILMDDGLSHAEARTVLYDFWKDELLYCPHKDDVANN